ncbi:hypothetical protein WN943_028376 [Citrus x changshan-huyou]
MHGDESVGSASGNIINDGETLGDSARISGGSLTNAGAAAARVEKQGSDGNFDGDVKS